MMNRWLVVRRVALYGSGGLLAAVVLLAIATLIPRRWHVPPNQDCRFTVYVSGGAMHTNLIVPISTPIFDWRNHLDLESIGNTNAETYRYLQFGWGDRTWYMQTPSWDRVNYLDIFRVLLLPGNTTALLVKGHATVPRYAGEELKCLRLSQADYSTLMGFIQQSFQPSLQGEKQRLGDSQDRESGFYAATGYYSALRTCNSWTAEALQSANVNTPLWSGLATPVMAHLRNGCACNIADSVSNNSGLVNRRDRKERSDP
jgi:uncharacterized protein (TIGR02117 family)